MPVQRPRYGIHIPAAGAAPAWSWWNGDDDVTIAGRSYTAGQFASADEASPVTPIVSGALADSFDTLATFAADGLFRTWLLSGDPLGRSATILTFKESATPGTWEVDDSASGVLGEPSPNDDGTISVALSSRISDKATLPRVWTAGAQSEIGSGDTAGRFQPALHRGYQVFWPSN